MWLLSCFFTSGWIHSCSREPSTHTRGLVEETVGGAQGSEGGGPSAVQRQEPRGLHREPREAWLTRPGSQREWLGRKSAPGSRGERGFHRGTGLL